MITNGAAPSGALAVVHDVRGRLRLRLPPHTNTRGLRDAVAGIDGVTACEWSPRTRSLLVRYQPERTAADTVLEVIGHQTGLPPARARASTPGPPAFGTAVREVFSDVNTRLSRWTGGALDLAALVPLSLTAWALREIVRGQVAPLAWSTALWYAHGLFRDYSLSASASPRPDE
jgi:hypothetical protein